jgi:uncharacterized protein
MPRVIHFELSAEDPERAAKFYSDVFGWQAQKWDGPHEYWLLLTGDESKPGINGGLMRQIPEFPARTPINTLDVDSLDEYVAKVESAGGKIVVPKMAVPTIGWLAYAQDTEGTLFGMMQSDPAAA